MSDETDSQNEVFAFLADPATHGGREGAADRHPCGVGISRRRPGAEGQARRALSLSRLFDAQQSANRPARPSLRSTRPMRRKSIAASSPITREADGKLAIGGAGAPVEWAVEMRRFDETAHARPPRRRDRRGAGRRAWPRRRRGARQNARGRGASRGSRRLASYIDEHVEAFRQYPDIFPCRRSRGARRAPAAPPMQRIVAASARARPARFHPPHSRRPSSRQHRADRRPAGSVRRHRIQRHHCLRRRFLRSRFPAHGPPRARIGCGRKYRFQPLSC